MFLHCLHSKLLENKFMLLSNRKLSVFDCNEKFTVYSLKTDAIRIVFGKHYTQLSEEETERFLEKHCKYVERIDCVSYLK